MDHYGPHTALIVVDMQNDFVHPDGSLHVSGSMDAIHRVNAEIAAARAAGSPVVYTQDWHPPDTPHFVDQGGNWPPHCVRDTWGARLHDDLDVPPDPVVVKKGTGMEDGYSGFTVYDLEADADQPTELDRILRDQGIERTIVVGVATDVCVRATALDAAKLGYVTEVIPEATAAVDQEEGDGERALEEMADHGIAIVSAAT
ncbi:MAG: isochorismatase family protein [Acidimicrobiales bacterium]|nr:isochorismatase family protein [Acidimicrobiales bacterium]